MNNVRLWSFAKRPAASADGVRKVQKLTRMMPWKWQFGEDAQYSNAINILGSL